MVRNKGGAEGLIFKKTPHPSLPFPRGLHFQHFQLFIYVHFLNENILFFFLSIAELGKALALLPWLPPNPNLPHIRSPPTLTYYKLSVQLRLQFVGFF